MPKSTISSGFLQEGEGGDLNKAFRQVLPTCDQEILEAVIVAGVPQRQRPPHLLG